MVKYTEHDPPQETEDWELDFSWPPKIPPPDFPCDNCGDPVSLYDSVAVTKFNGIDDVTLHFCGQTCADEFYLAHLRSSGGL